MKNYIFQRQSPTFMMSDLGRGLIEYTKYNKCFPDKIYLLPEDYLSFLNLLAELSKEPKFLGILVLPSTLL